MVSVYDLFGTNEQDEIDGRWLYHGDEKLDTTPAVQLRYLGGPNTKALEAIKAEEFAAYEGEDIDEDHPASVRVFIRAAVAGWRNMPSAAEPVDFNLDNAVKLLTELPHMRRIWTAFARDIRSYKNAPKRPTAEKIKATRKN